MTFKIGAALAVLMAGGVACDSMLTRPSLYSAVSVAVQRRDGQPVANAPLILYTGVRQMDLGSTDSSGRHTFERVPTGIYGVRTIAPAGYASVESVLRGNLSDVADKLVVSSDSAVSVRLTLLQIGPGRIVGRVLDEKRRPMAGLSVSLYDPSRVNATIRTDSAGYVVFDNVPFGLHGVTLTRPFYYRDFDRLQDSLYAVRDNIIAERDRVDSLSFVLTRCAGNVDVLVMDDANLPVAGATLAFFTPTDGLGVTVSGADGHSTHEGPCANQIGVAVNPPLGYSASGRGSAFTDGITLTNGATARVTLRVHRAP